MWSRNTDSSSSNATPLMQSSQSSGDGAKVPKKAETVRYVRLEPGEEHPGRPTGLDANIKERDILRWTAQASDHQLLRVLRYVAETRAELIRKVLKQYEIGESDLKSNMTNVTGRSTSTTSHSESAMMLPVDTKHSNTGDVTIVQTGAPIYYVMEGKDSVTVDVFRIGDLSGISEVRYTTVDGSAHADHSYKKQEGVLTFHSYESHKSVRIKLMENDEWDHPTREFYFVLCTKDQQGCELGRYDWNSRIQIIEDDTFPSNQYAAEIKDRRLHDIPNNGLLWDYIALNMRVPTIWWGTVKTFIAIQMDNLFFGLKLLVNVYVIDYVFEPSNTLLLTDDRGMELMCIMGIMIVPFLLLHVLHYMQLSFKVSGTSRTLLQSALMSKFLHYDHHSRAEVRGTKLMMSMTKDVHDVVTNGFTGIFDLAHAFGTVAVILAYQIFLPLVLGKAWSSIGLGVAIGIPILSLCFLGLRQRVVFRYVEEVNTQETAFVTHVDEVLDNFGLICNFNQRPATVEKFTFLIAKFNKALTASSQVILNNEHFAPWLTTIMAGVWICVGGHLVLTDLLSVGMFVTNLQALGSIGAAASEINRVVVQMQVSFPALHRLVLYLNLPTDLVHRLWLTEHRRELTNRVTDDLLRKGHHNVIDMISIKLHGVHFSYDEKHIRNLGTLEFNQGQLVVMIGPRGNGKATMLKVLACVNLPTLPDKNSVFFIASHLRVLYVPAEICFVTGTLYENLIYGTLDMRTGTSPNDPDASMDRVLSICKRLNFPLHLRDEVQFGEGDSWLKSISRAEGKLLSLARAFVANPEIIVFDKPVDTLNDVDTRNLLQQMKEFVSSKGLEQDSKPALRRPRTCVFTSSKLLGVQVADVVLHVTAEGTRQIEKHRVTEAMLR